jgi:trimeric autotransporter adhesin
MKFRACCITLNLLFALACTTLAQTTLPNSSQASIQVPRLIRFSGVAQDETHNPINGLVGVTFSLYKDQQGGSPLWAETQNVQADTVGHYTALLGSASAEGVPMELFSSGEAQWLGVQIQGQSEHARVLLVSVPYALKAQEAETLSGKSITDFVLVNKNAGSSANAANTPGSNGTSGSILPRVNNDDPTNFSGANATQIVGVTQKGIGLGLSATANTSAAVAGTITGKSNTAIYGHASNASKGSNAAGVTGQSNTETGPGVAGYTSSSQGTGVIGVANASSGGTGVSGIANATTGQVYGVSGSTSSTGQFAAGVSGTEFAASGEQVYGVTGYTVSSGLKSAGVNGWEAATTGEVIGVSGGTNSTGQYSSGVSGYEGAATGQVYGVGGYNVSAGPNAAGVSGYAAATTGQVYGVLGTTPSISGDGVYGNATATSGNTSGVFGQSYSPNGNGVLGVNNAKTGFSPGVMGVTNSGTSAGVYGYNATTSGHGSAVQGQIEGSPFGAAGVFAAHGGVGLILNGLSGSNYTQEFSVDASGNGFYAGNLTVTGKLTKGSGSFKIDDPLDPANKYLSHSFVESPDMMNVYNGNITTDRHGLATVTLPDYFEALNGDFRYQLTVIGQFAQSIVARKIANNRFVIQTNKANVEVSWQVTGIRHDAYANTYRIPVEENKAAGEQGYYLHPEVFGQPNSKSIQAVSQKASADQLAKASNP